MHRRIALVVAFVAANLMACCCGGFGRQTPPNQNVVAEKVGEQKPAPPAFLTPDQAANHGNIKFSLLSGSIKKITHFDTIFNRTFESAAGERLRLVVSLENTSKTKIENYIPWSKPSFVDIGTRAKVTDEHGNHYRIVLPAIGQTPVGQIDKTARIEPGKKLEDVLIFERPIDAAQEFTVEFPASNFGSKDRETIVYKFPRTWLEK